MFKKTTATAAWILLFLSVPALAQKTPGRPAGYQASPLFAHFRGVERSTLLAFAAIPVRGEERVNPSPKSSPPFNYRRVDFKNYILVEKGMSEAQVLSLLGPPSWVDRWTCDVGEECHLKKVYYYLGNPAHREMTTVIYFTDGKVTSKERFRSWLSQ